MSWLSLDLLWSGVCALFKLFLMGLGDFLGDVLLRSTVVVWGVCATLESPPLTVAELSKLSQKEMLENCRRQLEELSSRESMAWEGVRAHYWSW